MYVLMISPNRFPNGDAGAIRDEYFARIYQELGYDVYIICRPNQNMGGEYKKIRYMCIEKKEKSFVGRASDILSYKNSVKTIYNDIYNKEGFADLIHIYDIPKSGISWAKKISKQNNIKLIHDSVEWYSPCEFKYGKFSYPYILKNRTNTKLITKPFSVIAISTFLERYFRSRGLNCIRIPVMMDSDEYTPIYRKNTKKIEIVYAGSPAKKDYLMECVQAFEKMDNKNKEKFTFHIFGVNRDIIKSFCKVEVPKEIIVYGRVPREHVISCLANADFSILIRPAEERYTKAGFPTKSVEAMMNGCAMICNLTSDLNLYLKDEENAIIVDNHTTESVCKTFERVANLERSKIDNIKENARKTAIKSFDYRIYIDLMKDFIETI